MEVNSINNNNISTINNSPQLQVDRSVASGKIENDSLSLNINQYNQRRDELSLNVQSLNQGLASSKIAQNALAKQDEYLSNIESKLEDLKTDENISTIKAEDTRNDINKELQNFNQVAFETKFANKTLLSTDPYEDSNDIEVNTSTNNFSITKPNTPQIASNIFESLNQADLTNEEQLDNSLNTLSVARQQIQSFSNDFGIFENELKEDAKINIQEQQNLYNQNRANQNKDFGKESTDFNSSNVNANAGYLAASQANIVQEQSVRLLS